MQLNLQEVARYLGYGARQLEPEVENLVIRCETELEQVIRPRFHSHRVEAATLPFTDSEDLAYHLRHCQEAFLIALTLGTETDRLLRRWTIEHVGKAAVGQACAAVWMDDCCDSYLLQLEKKLPPGEYLLPPYSPGYGDFSLAHQGTLLGFLDASRRLGISLTQGGMLVPEKTITAVVGISPVPAERCIQKCWRCEKSDCPFRKGSDL